MINLNNFENCNYKLQHPHSCPYCGSTVLELQKQHYYCYMCGGKI